MLNIKRLNTPKNSIATIVNKNIGCLLSSLFSIKKDDIGLKSYPTMLATDNEIIENNSSGIRNSDRDRQSQIFSFLDIVFL